MTMRLEFAAAPEVRQVLDRLGRTEDLHFSPSGRRLALAGFAGNRIVILDVEIAASRSGTSVALTGSIELAAPGLSDPHGVFFVNEETLVVANRTGGVTGLKVPPSEPGVRALVVSPLESMRASKWLHSPGSVSVAPLGRDRYELLVCNNYAHYVSRHVVGVDRDLVVESNEILLSQGLSVPDGVAVDRDNRWIAVSNHGGRTVLLFENAPQLNLRSHASGVLGDVACPHGVRFSPDDEFVLVADAGAPFVHVYAKDGDSWRGERKPIASCRVMDDETFLRGRYNPEEGGPKGIDVDREMRVLVTTCEHQPLAFFDLPAILGQRRSAPSAAVPASGTRAAPGGPEMDSDRRPASGASVGRAAPCPCGSGKRFKHCCGRSEPVADPARSFGSIMGEALKAQRSGSLDLAEALYRDALRLRPEHPDALHMLGVVCHCLARGREASALIRRAGEVTRWGMAGVLHNYSLALGSRMLGRTTGLTARLRLEYDRWLAQRARDDSPLDPDMLVSVVLPSHNHADHVEPALESAFAQTYRHLELIVVDDGSSDASPEVIRRKLQSCPFPFQFVVRANQGASAALNEAIRLARGAFVNPLNSDDVFEPTRIADMVQQVAHRGFEWGFAKCICIDKDGHAVAADGDRRARQLAEIEHLILSSDTVGAALLSGFNPAVSTGNLFFSRSLYERLGGFRDCRSRHDWDFCLRALRIAEPCFVPTVSYRCRLHDANATAESHDRNRRVAAALFADYHLGVLEAPPANRFAPARSSMGWSCLGKGLAAGQGDSLPPEILIHLEGELDAEDDRALRRVDGRQGNGLNVVGFLRGDFGLAEGARALAKSCRDSGIPASFHDPELLPDMRQSSRAMDTCLTDDMLHRNTLFYMNPDQLKLARQRFADRGELRGRRVIGYWFWEIDAFPTQWRPALDMVDEIWVASEFVGNAVRRATDKPVVKIPNAIEVSLSRRYTRAEFSLPEGRFLFLFTFDFNSSFERKNPLATIEAFSRAFPAGDDRAGLVVKCRQGSRDPEKMSMLHALAAKDPRIVVLDRMLSREAAFGLQSVCDAYISLHRSEGFGLGMAECMAQRKPVIATAYSGNLEFMRPDNSCLVDFTLIPVRPGEYVDYEPGWMWADPDIDQAARYMVRLVDDPDHGKRIGDRAASDMALRHGHRVAAAAIAQRLAELAQAPRLPEAVERSVA